MKQDELNELLGDLDRSTKNEVKSVAKSKISAFRSKLEPVRNIRDEKEIGKLLPIEVALLVLAKEKEKSAEQIIYNGNLLSASPAFKKLSKSTQRKKIQSIEKKIEKLCSTQQLLTDIAWNHAQKRIGYTDRIVELRKGGIVVSPTIQFPLCPHCKTRHPTSADMIGMLVGGMFGRSMRVVVVPF